MFHNHFQKLSGNELYERSSRSPGHKRGRKRRGNSPAQGMHMDVNGYHTQASPERSEVGLSSPARPRWLENNHWDDQINKRSESYNSRSAQPPSGRVPLVDISWMMDMEVTSPQMPQLSQKQPPPPPPLVPNTQLFRTPDDLRWASAPVTVQEDDPAVVAANYNAARATATESPPRPSQISIAYGSPKVGMLTALDLFKQFEEGGLATRNDVRGGVQQPKLLSPRRTLMEEVPQKVSKSRMTVNRISQHVTLIGTWKDERGASFTISEPSATNWEVAFEIAGNPHEVLPVVEATYLSNDNSPTTVPIDSAAALQDAMSLPSDALSSLVTYDSNENWLVFTLNTPSVDDYQPSVKMTFESMDGNRGTSCILYLE